MHAPAVYVTVINDRVGLLVWIICNGALGLTDSVFGSTLRCVICNAIVSDSTFLPALVLFFLFFIAICTESIHHQICLSMCFLPDFVFPWSLAAVSCTCRFKRLHDTSRVLPESLNFAVAIAVLFISIELLIFDSIYLIGDCSIYL